MRLSTLADIVVATLAGRVRAGLVRRLRDASDGAMMVLGAGLPLARRPAG